VSRFEANYYSSVDEIYHDRWSTNKLLRIRWLKQSIDHFWPKGHPSRLIHVAGTNGKGSVCRMLEAALDKEGGAGALTNPHLFDYAERTSRHGENLSHKTVTRLWRDLVQPHSLDRAELNPVRALSFAEAGILMALLAFDESKLAWGLVETGVGGRYSPSMAINPALTILTNVGEDHHLTLGRTIWQRALEKAGIIRRDTPIITAATGEALFVIQSQAEELNAPLIAINNERVSQFKEKWRNELSDYPALADHGWINRCLCYTALSQLNLEISLDEFALRIKEASPLPGRYWQVDSHTLADVAHNPDKLKSLRDTLDIQHAGHSLILVMGISRNRALEPMLATLVDRLDEVIFTTASYAGRDPHELEAECRRLYPGLAARVVEEPREAVKQAQARRQNEQLVLITGSAYTIDQALNPDPHLRTLNSEYGRRGSDILRP
jgi:dihydrofolate synthase/folylpolyglutamate synthase